MMAVAAQLGAAHVVFPDLRVTSGVVEVRLRLYEPATQRLVAVPRAMAPLGAVGEACEDTAVRLLAFMGVASRPGPPPQLDELAASGRALLHRDRGDLFRAWREVERKLSPTAVATRKDVVRAAMNSNARSSERARVLAAAGEAGRAWTLVQQDVQRALRQPQPDPKLLLAAAEIELARTNPREARRYVEKLLQTGAEDAEVQRTYARVLLDQNDAAGARQALGRAVKLDPTDSRDLRAAGRARGGGSAAARGAASASRPARGAAHESPSSGEPARSRGAGRAGPRGGVVAKPRRVPPDVGTSRGIPGRLPEGRGGRWRRRHAPIAGSETPTARWATRARRRKPTARRWPSEPDDPDSLNGLGAVHLDLDEPEEALPLLRRSVELEPADAVKRRNLAQALRATGDLEGALELLEETPEGWPPSLRHEPPAWQRRSRRSSAGTSRRETPCSRPPGSIPSIRRSRISSPRLTRRRETPRVRCARASSRPFCAGKRPRSTPLAAEEALRERAGATRRSFARRPRLQLREPGERSAESPGDPAGDPGRADVAGARLRLAPSARAGRGRNRPRSRRGARSLVRARRRTGDRQSGARGAHRSALRVRSSGAPSTRTASRP